MRPIFSDGAEVRSLAQVAWCGTAAMYSESGKQIIDAAEARANARLIAAAPDLLDSLERLLHELANGPATSTALREAHIAVARAKGET